MWTANDQAMLEANLAMLERLTPVCALHIRSAMADAVDRHREAMAEVQAVKDRIFLRSIGINA